jgi:hypothetical protein
MSNCRYPAILWLLLLPIATEGQTLSELLKNPDISWVAEVENDWIVDQTGYFEEKVEINKANLLKWIQPTDMKGTGRDEMMQRVLLERVIYPKTPVFTDANCTIPLNWSDLIIRDTSPCSGEAFVREIAPEIEEFSYIRLHQLLYYNTKKVALGCAFMSAAIMVKDRNSEDENTRHSPFCWLKIETKEPKNYEYNKDIILAIQTIAQSDKNLMNKNVRTLKTPAPGFDPVSHWFERLPLPDKKRTRFYSNNYFAYEPLTLDQRRKIIAWQDTTEQYDIDTQKTSVVVESHRISPADIRELRLVYTWYWDDKKRRLIVHLDAGAPMFDVKDEDGYFRYKMPLFYLLAD